MARQKPLTTGIWFWDGLPGSGKSFGAVDLIINTILEQRRPVYTNLPLKFRVISTYLAIRGMDRRLASYILPLTQDHFFRFLTRNEERQEFVERMKQDGVAEAHAGRMYDVTAGSGIIRGSEADWLPAGAVVVIDEAHLWFDQKRQRDEVSGLLRYVTMHRHHMHWVHVLSQDKMQVSLTWRRNCELVVHCTDKRKLPFMFGLALPIAAFAYEYWPKEYADSQNTGGMRPVKTEVRIPAISGGLIWRFYSSFVHMGSQRRLMRELDKTRQLIEGDGYVAPKAKGNDMAKVSGKVKWLAIGGVLLVVGLVYSVVRSAVRVSSGSFVSAPAAVEDKPKVDISVEALQRREESERLAVERMRLEKELAEAAVERSALAGLPVVHGVSKGLAVIEGGSAVNVGGSVGLWRLQAVDFRAGASLWVCDDPVLVRTVRVGLRRQAVESVGGSGPAVGSAGSAGRKLADRFRAQAGPSD